MTAVTQFKEFIAKSNLRMTRERELVIQAIFEEHDHFTVQKIAEKLYEQGHQIARSTVYRMLPHLMDAGLIRKAPGGDCSEEQVYEPIAGRPHHDHLICDVCGEVVEFKDDEIEALQEKVAGKFGYRLKKHHLELVGVCPACQEKILKQAVSPWQ
ncbi:MAG TPA: Fur family transcriptional regulator [bacterium]|nr:Fur family transcriptional regulator [bacterium]